MKNVVYGVKCASTSALMKLTTMMLMKMLFVARMRTA